MKVEVTKRKLSPETGELSPKMATETFAISHALSQSDLSFTLQPPPPFLSLHCTNRQRVSAVKIQVTRSANYIKLTGGFFPPSGRLGMGTTVHTSMAQGCPLSQTTTLLGSSAVPTGLFWSLTSPHRWAGRIVTPSLYNPLYTILS